MQTSAAGNFQPTESLFAVYREPFFNNIGQKRKFSTQAHVVRFTVESRHAHAISARPLRATSRLMQRSKKLYSITLSARAITVGGTMRPSSLARLTLMVSSKVVGCCIGRSAGLAPLRILST